MRRQISTGGMEIRGVGIMRVEKAPASPVILAVRLDPEDAIARLPEPAFFTLPAALQADVKVPLISLNAHEASTPAKIAAAAAGLVRGAFVAGAFLSQSPLFSEMEPAIVRALLICIGR